MTVLAPQSADEAIDIVMSNDSVLPHGSRTKASLLAASESFCQLDTSGLTGIIEYEPTEFTFTAKAGTPISEITQVLDANDQWMPFDPAFSSADAKQNGIAATTNGGLRSATLAGAIASGLNGPCSLRFGGARDFVLRIKFIDGIGNHITAGGKVVKNAAGFDLPKFFVGSCGRFGVLTELTMKVFPKSESYSTLVLEGSLTDHLNWIKKLNSTPLEFEAIDIFDGKLFVRIGGSERTLSTAQSRIEELVTCVSMRLDSRIEIQEDAFWSAANRFEWSTALALIKVPTHILQVPDLLRLFESITTERQSANYRISLAGQVVYFGVEPKTVSDFISSLASHGFAAQAIRNSQCVTPPFQWSPFATKIKKALDPDNRFGAFESPP